MDIPNLAQTPTPNIEKNSSSSISLPLIIIIVTFAIASGFFVSRFTPSTSSTSSSQNQNSISGETPLSTDNISSSTQIKVGTLYGNTTAKYSDNATGVLQSGGVNGEGTHTLEREGGVTQRAALTSSSVDLDLFVGKKVEIHGQTQSSTRAGWFLDVISIKVLE